MLARKYSLVLIIPAVLLISGCTSATELSVSRAIPFKTTKVEDPALAKGTTVVEKSGKSGVMTVSYEDQYSGDQLVSRKKIKQEISVRPVDQVEKVGTKQSISFNVPHPTGNYELVILSAARAPSGFAIGAAKSAGDTVVVKGKLRLVQAGAAPLAKNPAQNTFADLVITHPTLPGGTVILPVVPAVGKMVVGQVADVTWFGSVNAGKPGQNPGIADIKELQVVPRIMVGPKNVITGQSQPLDVPAS